jgi:hypothetical protein
MHVDENLECMLFRFDVLRVNGALGISFLGC